MVDGVSSKGEESFGGDEKVQVVTGAVVDLSCNDEVFERRSHEEGGLEGGQRRFWRWWVGCLGVLFWWGSGLFGGFGWVRGFWGWWVGCLGVLFGWRNGLFRGFVWVGEWFVWGFCLGGVVVI